MSLINAVLARTFDLLLAPFRQLPPIVGLAVVSLATAIALLLIFRRTSDQAGLASVKRQIHAALFEIRLFNDDLRAIFRAQGEILRHNLTYLRLSLVPMLWVMAPLVLVIAQLQFHYGYAPLGEGEVSLLEVRLAESWQESGALPVNPETGKPQVRPEVPRGLAVETPAVWVPSERTPPKETSYDSLNPRWAPKET